MSFILRGMFSGLRYGLPGGLILLARAMWPLVSAIDRESYLIWLATATGLTLWLWFFVGWLVTLVAVVIAIWNSLQRPEVVVAHWTAAVINGYSWIVAVNWVGPVMPRA